VRVFDSNAILLYLAEKSGKFLGQPEDRGEFLSWLMFIATGLGPFSGQAVHFQHVAPEGNDYGVNRYRNEIARHYQVLEDHLEGRDFIVGDEMTIVDISAWGWVDKAPFVHKNPDVWDKYPNIKRWFDAINRLPAAVSARDVGKDHAFKTEMDEEAKRAMFPSNYA
ncbi:MAG TPA: glutathione S-transferase, partial [Thalassospira sp.]|nr:glutathione S-transferase [Thalassospira sp.]